MRCKKPNPDKVSALARKLCRLAIAEPKTNTSNHFDNLGPASRTNFGAYARGVHIHNVIAAHTGQHAN